MSSIEATSGLSKSDRIVDLLLSFGELTKPELTGLSVLTAIFAFFLGSSQPGELYGYLGLAAATLLVGGGAGALNQWLERDLDGLMKRTERRPLPAGRMPHRYALVFGAVTTVSGNVLLLLLFGLIPCLVGCLTSILYLFVYTPLKRRTWHNTSVGAIPGALPVLIGWSASGEPLTIGAWLLFFLVFLWQFPHFLSLAWLYRKDYAKAGFRMLPVIDSEEGRRTSRLNLLFSGVLVAVSVGMAVQEGLYGYYLVGIIVGNGMLLLAATAAFRASRRPEVQSINVNKSARTLFFASLLYLPLLMGTALLDRI